MGMAMMKPSRMVSPVIQMCGQYSGKSRIMEVKIAVGGGRIQVCTSSTRTSSSQIPRKATIAMIGAIRFMILFFMISNLLT